MPWKPSDASKHTSKANTPHKAKVWARVANQVLRVGGDEGKAIREANAVVARVKGKK